MQIPEIPDAVQWRDGIVLEPAHFKRTDKRSAKLAYVSGLVSDPWPWGFLSERRDETALASGELRIKCSGIFPDGDSFRAEELSHVLPPGQNGAHISFDVVRNPEGDTAALQVGSGVPSESCLPVARLTFHGGSWGAVRDWSPPALLVGSDHPMRLEMNQQLGGLASIGAGFMTTLRMPGAEERPAARALGLVGAAIAQGVGVIQALMGAPVMSPGRLGIEALRLALGVRGAAGIFEPLDVAWDPADQRGSLRRILYAAEAAASGIGLPFRAAAFRDLENTGVLTVEGLPPEVVLLAIEASRPSDLIAGRSWLEGAALAEPGKIQEALNRRVAGCGRQAVERDPRIGVSSGPLLGLYYVENDINWRGSSSVLALAAKIPPPVNTSFSILLPESATMGGVPGGQFTPPQGQLPPPPGGGGQMQPGGGQMQPGGGQMQPGGGQMPPGAQPGGAPPGGPPPGGAPPGWGGGVPRPGGVG